MAIDLTTLGASDGTGESVQASVTVIRAPGASTIVVDSLAHWPAKFIATTSRLITVSTGSGTTQTILDPSRILVFNGHTSSGQIIIDSLAPGYVDTYGSSVSDVVVIKPTTLWADGVQGALQVAHNSDGTIKANAVGAGDIAAGVVTNATLSTTAGELGGAWQTWTPTFSGFTLGNGTVNIARYYQIGKTVHAILYVSLGNTSPMTGPLSISAPVPINSTYPTGFATIIGDAVLQSTGTFTSQGAALIGSTNLITIRAINTTGTYATHNDVSGSVPAVWKPGDVFGFTVTYEAA